MIKHQPMTHVLCVIAVITFANSVGAEDPRVAAGFRAAKAYAEATLNQDFGKVVDGTYDRLVEAHGGREQMLAMTKAVFAQMKEQQGIVLRQLDVKPAKVHGKSKAELFSYFPTRMSIAFGTKVVTDDAYLLGISGDKGRTWKFLDKGVLSDPSKRKFLVPNLPSKIERELQAAAPDDGSDDGDIGLFLSEEAPKDPAKAFEWYRNAAEQGDPRAQYWLGMMYVAGFGVSRDYAKGMDWLTKAAEQGDAEALWHLGNIYAVPPVGAESPFDVKHDNAKAIAWWSKAAERGHAVAVNALIGVHQDGTFGVSKDAVKAFEWATKGAEQGDYEAQFALAKMYETGEGVQKDASTAVEWRRKALYNYGIVCRDGDIYPSRLQNPSRFKKEKDLVRAHISFNHAAALGHENAANARQSLESEMTKEQIAEAEKYALESRDAHPELKK